MWILSLLPLAFYLPLFNGFFQQDEWYGFAWYVLHSDSLKYIFASSVGHWNPLTLGVNHMLFSLWGMNYSSFLVVSLLLHAIATLLVYLLAKEIFGKPKPAIVAAFLFTALAGHFQGTAWVVANIGTHLATILGLLSALFFLRRRLLSSLVFLVVSLLFKETTIGLFPLYLLYIFFVAKKDKAYKSSARIVVGWGLAYLFVRVLMFFGPNVAGDQLVTQSQDISKLLYNFVTVPVKAISQSIFPSEFLLIVSGWFGGLLPEKIAGMPGTPQFESFVVKRVLEAISLALAGGVAAWSVVKIKYSKLVVFGLAWIVTNSFIFAFAPEHSGVIFTIDSRNLYFVSVGTAIFLTALASHFYKSYPKVVVVVLSILILVNGYWLNRNISGFVKKGEVRKSILTQMKNTYPDLPEKVVFYTKSSQSYYGLPPEEKILPFQSGLGQTLLVWYYPQEGFPKEFFENRFLWPIEEQGYEQFGNRGFGYFRDLDLLREAVDQYNLPKQSVIAFSWDGKKNFLTDITQEVRDEIYAQKD